MLLLNFRAKKPCSQKGFSMMEVLVAILTLTLFLTGTLQLVAIDALYKMRSKQEARAQFWIQEDLEQILALANKTIPTDDADFPSTHIWFNAACLPEMRANGESFAQALRNEIIEVYGDEPTEILLEEKGVSLNSKTYKMTRTYDITDEEPSVLKINYQVIDVNAEDGKDNDINKSDDFVIATHYAEVIPHESFKCR